MIGVRYTCVLPFGASLCRQLKKKLRKQHPAYRRAFDTLNESAMNKSPSRQRQHPYKRTQQTGHSMSDSEMVEQCVNMSDNARRGDHGDVALGRHEILEQQPFVRPRRHRESSSGSRSEDRAMEVQQLERKYNSPKKDQKGVSQTWISVTESYCVKLTPPTRRARSMDICPPLTIVDTELDHKQQDVQQRHQHQKNHNKDNNHLSSNEGESSVADETSLAHPPLMVDSGVCQCCYDEITTMTLTCYNERTPHPICHACVTSYVREWLHGGNRNGVIHSGTNNNNRIPCLCSGDFGCSSFVAIGDWNSILSKVEIKLLDERLISDRKYKIRRHSSSELRRDTPVVNTASVAPKRKSLVRRTYDDLWEDSQHEIEEIKTRARLRSCPTCDKTFLKESGCNKVTCPNCLTSMCYCCRKIVPAQGYDHFYVEGKDDLHHKLNRCPLWTDDNGDKWLEKKFIKDNIYRMAQEMRQYA